MNKRKKRISKEREARAKEREDNIEINRERVNRYRERETYEQKIERQARNREERAKSRGKETLEDKIKRINKNKESMSNAREKKIILNLKSIFVARNAQDILDGKQIVKELNESKENIGSLNIICQKCSAKKWRGETSSTCCNDGKVILDRYPDPPLLLRSLWTANTPEARLFRENSRSFNNALALASLKVEERKFSGGYTPSVVFEGKVSILCGPLMPEENEQPRFSQLYIHDPATQHTMRVKNMNLPISLSSKQTDSITKTMKKLHDLMIEVNPFVKDFLHICEIPDEEIKEGKLVISCNARPSGEHERRYNEQKSLSEVSVLTNSEKGDLVLRKRGGGLQFISDLHPAAQPLHFTLLFPYGTKGYSESEKKKGHNGQNSVRRVTPREFFAFHINMREFYSDFLFRGSRLFQEYLCIAFTTIENQRLKFVQFNQKALRADSYKNLKDIITDRVPMTDKVLPGDDKLKMGRKIILPSNFV